MWVGDDTPSWSTDGRAILLPGTFLKSNQNAPSRPCVAVVDLSSTISTCVETLKGHTDEKGSVEEGYHFTWAAKFVGGDKRRVKVTFLSHEDESIQTTEYQQDPEGRWRAVEDVGLKVTVKQSFKEPPRLVASDGHVSRIIWDPNPQLKDIDLGEVALYKWKDKEGRERKGELYKPKNYKPGQRYPLVLLSNTNDIHFQMIRRSYPLLDHFDHFVLSYQVGVLKPSPRIYEEAVARAGCRAEECFFTDDVVPYVEGARQAGLDAVRFESYPQLVCELRSRGVSVAHASACWRGLYRVLKKSF